MGHIKIREAAAGDGGFLFRLMNDPMVLRALHEVPTQLCDGEEETGYAGNLLVTIPNY